MTLLEIKDKKLSSREISNQKKHILQFLPTQLDKVSSTKFIIHNNIKLKSSYIIDIVNTLLLKYYFKKENSFNLSSTILREKYGYNYNHYMSYLLSHNIILLIKNHQKGKNSRVYKLNDDIIKVRIENRYRNRDSTLLKKYKLSIVDDSSDMAIPLLIREKLIRDLFSAKINTNDLIFYMDSVDVYNKNKYSVDCISDSHIFYHFDGFGRLHTNFTILKSEIRKNCLLIDGEETSEKDIMNSQPLFLSKLIYERDCFTIDESEFNTFKEITFSGRFYQYIMDMFPEYTHKKFAKEMVYKVFFGRNYKNCKHDINFKKAFPTIYDFIKSYKRENGDYRSLAYYLQKVESNFIFNGVIGALMNKQPEIKIITVHDSLIYAEKYESIISDIFNQKFKEEFYFLF